MDVARRAAILTHPFGRKQAAQMTVIDLADKRPPVCYTVHLTQHWDGRLQVTVQDVAEDERSRKAVAAALRDAAELLERPQS